MDKIFVVHCCGVYIQGIVGVFNTLEAAKEVAERFQKAENEEDGYHFYEVVEVPVNMPAKWEVRGSTGTRFAEFPTVHRTIEQRWR